MRTPKLATPPIIKAQPDPEMITQERTYKVITALYGGGVEPGKADDITVVRVPEIRGQLRFWWRACRGGHFDGDLAKMKIAEGEIWGLASRPGAPMDSRVQVVITDYHQGEIDRPYEVVAGNPDRNGKPRPKIQPRRGSEVPPYVAFPLQPTEGEARIGMETLPTYKAVEFTLKISYPKDKKIDIEAAIWAWETFGGIGGRTRRGFGAICCTTVNSAATTLPHHQTIVKEIEENLQKYVVSGVWPTGIPHLNHKPEYKVTPLTQTPIATWKYLTDALKSFRQSRNPGNAANRPGRSRWPEPEAIREITGQRHSDHPQLRLQLKRFPRAQFGLPIIFHFKDANRRNPSDPNSDPRQTSLQGEKHERLASRLILRPLLCANKQAVGIALILTGPSTPPSKLPGELMLKGAPNDPSVSSQINEVEVEGVLPLHGETDVLKAFLNTLRSL